MVRTEGWSPIGKRAVTHVLSARGASQTIFGAVCSSGIVALSVRLPKASKKRKVAGSSKTIHGNNGDGGGTKGSHYQEFVLQLLDEMDKHDMKGYNLVMDNTPIHKAGVLQEIVEERGYKCVYLPPYSPFLNPIEECWSKIKTAYCNDVHDENDSVSKRVYDAACKVTKEDLIGWIQHSLTFFPRCLAKELDL